jgi:hypothetical protein
VKIERNKFGERISLELKEMSLRKEIKELRKRGELGDRNVSYSVNFYSIHYQLTNI